jgi:hypothetical protein
MRKLICPQCKIQRFRIKNDKGDSIIVTVNENLEIEPLNESETLEGFDLNTLYCLGCSWQGAKNKLVKY